MLSYLAGFLDQKGFAIESANGTDLPFFFQLLISVTQHQSLTVSIPVLHVLSKLLASERIGNSGIMTDLVPSLLGICTERLIRWESLPADSSNPTVEFLNEDIDTIPEKHAFAGNYRRYCSSIIETTVLKRPAEAIHHILGVVNQNLDNLYAGVEPFNGQFPHKRRRSVLTPSSDNLHEGVNPAHACRHSVCSCGGNFEGLWQMGFGPWENATAGC